MSNFKEENSLQHSNSAISITHEFYDTRVMVYVEGVDDISFWDELLRKRVPETFYTIEQVNGKNNLKYYINGLLNGTITNVVVACDSDYNNILMNQEPDFYINPLIIKTYGHSIENTMFCPKLVAKYIRNIIKNTNDYYPAIKEWYDNFCFMSLQLLPYDILNQEEINQVDIGTKKKAFNENFYRLLDDTNKMMLDQHKVEEFISRIKVNYKDSDVEYINSRIHLEPRESRYIIQGHFLELAVMNLIRETIKQEKKVTLSNEAIFAYFIDCNTQCNSICEDRQFLFQQIDKVYHYFNP